MKINIIKKTQNMYNNVNMVYSNHFPTVSLVGGRGLWWQNFRVLSFINSDWSSFHNESLFPTVSQETDEVTICLGEGTHL